MLVTLSRVVNSMQLLISSEFMVFVHQLGVTRHKYHSDNKLVRYWWQLPKILINNYTVTCSECDNSHVEISLTTIIIHFITDIIFKHNVRIWIGGDWDSRWCIFKRITHSLYRSFESHWRISGMCLSGSNMWLWFFVGVCL